MKILQMSTEASFKKRIKKNIKFGSKQREFLRTEVAAKMEAPQWKNLELLMSTQI